AVDHGLNRFPRLSDIGRRARLGVQHHGHRAIVDRERHRVGAPRDSDLKRAPDCVRAHVLVLSFDPIVGAIQVARSRYRVSESIRLSLATVAGIGLTRSLALPVSTGPPWVGMA